MLLSLAVFLNQLHWLAPAAIMFGSAPCFLMLWWPARCLPKRLYRRADDFMFSTYLRLILFFFENCAGVEVILYGDVDALLSSREVENAVYISNHQNTVDWIIGCSVALRRGALGRCRFVVKDGLKYFPLYGFYLSQHETLFVKRGGKFEVDKAKGQLQSLVKKQCPMWMVIFPEGTRFNPHLKDVIQKSQTFAKQQVGKMLQEKGFCMEALQQVLFPHSKATQVCLQELSGHATSVYDLTIAYNNTRDPHTGLRTTSPGMPDFLSGHTRKVHIHISKIPMSEVPMEEPQVTQWLYRRFQLKDQLLSHFYAEADQNQASFPGEGRLVPLSLLSTFPSFLLWGGAFASCMALKELRSVYWKTGAVSLVIGLVYVSVKS